MSMFFKKQISQLNKMTQKCQTLYDDVAVALAVSKDENLFVGGDFITAPDPNNYGHEIVLGKKQSEGCPYCGNTSGLKDSRGMCVSCGGNLNG